MPLQPVAHCHKGHGCCCCPGMGSCAADHRPASGVTPSGCGGSNPGLSTELIASAHLALAAIRRRVTGRTVGERRPQSANFANLITFSLRSSTQLDLLDSLGRQLAYLPEPISLLLTVLRCAILASLGTEHSLSLNKDFAFLFKHSAHDS